MANDLTINEKIHDGVVAQQIFTLNFADQKNRRNNRVLKGTEADLRKLVLDWVDRLDGVNLASLKGATQIKKMTQEIALLRAEGWKNAREYMSLELRDYGDARWAYMADLWNDAFEGWDVPKFKDPTGKQVTAIHNEYLRKQILGDTFDNWWQRAVIKDAVAISTEVARLIGTDGVTGRQVVAAALKKAQQGFLDMDALGITTTVDKGWHTQEHVFRKSGQDWFVTKERYVATLDDKTTLICMDNDGRVFELGRGAIPPLHFRCRSIRVPFLTDESIGERGFDPTTEEDLVKEFSGGQFSKRSQLKGNKTAYDRFVRKRRRELIGVAPETLTYDQFLRKQSPAFVRRVLGVVRGNEYLSNKRLTVGSFVANRTGREFTLKELRQRKIIARE